jgi:hypothetical protein
MARSSQAERIQLSAFLSKLPMLGKEKAAEVKRLTPKDVVSVLKRAEIDFILAGAHGLAAWMSEPRATQDVDFLIKPRQAKPAWEALRVAFPELILEKIPDAWRLKRDAQYVIDLILGKSPLYKQLVHEFILIKVGAWKVKIPTLEAALAMKHSAMTGFYRSQAKKYLDARDFMDMLAASPEVDLEKCRELGELAFPSGGADLLRMIERARAGQPLEI